MAKGLKKNVSSDLNSFFLIYFRKVRNVQCVEVIYENRNGIHHKKLNYIFSLLMLFFLLFRMVVSSLYIFFSYKKKRTNQSTNLYRFSFLFLGKLGLSFIF